MKSFKLLVAAILLLSIIVVSCSNDDDTPGVTIIPVTMTVDVDALLAANLPADTEVSAFANFGQAGGISNADFLTEVGFGERVSWQATSASSATDEILFTAIIDDDFLLDGYTQLVVPDGEDDLYYEAPQPLFIREVVTTPVVDSTLKYSIYFNVVRNNIISANYLVDPKIKIKSTN
ncbi:MAG: hypothetical protein HKN00_00520 [Flavobacteriaceae bacterium]|nr:hypothetical protein [Bacteroidia bacterium]MBT8287127.1 hypothetical protein [Bacteroidia bacterium]NNF73639.1 hypothetical protein [Flavobacteriaceae bacterium]NNK72339.1 hypothetical protein [Flavobacteriaceae bacterium]